MTRLLVMVCVVLEQNIGAEAAARYKRTLWMHMTRTGAKLEAKWPHLSPGEGLRLLQQLTAMIIGLQSLSDAPPVVSRVLDELGLHELRIDFRRELARMTETYVLGLEHRSKARVRP